MKVRDLKKLVAEIPPEHDDLEVLRDDNNGMESVTSVRLVTDIETFPYRDGKKKSALVIGDHQVNKRTKYVLKAAGNKGWQIWNRKTNRKWGNPFPYQPEELLAELNGPKRPEKIVELTKKVSMRHG